MSWVRPRIARRPSPRKPLARRRPLALTPLEDRCVPAGTVWTQRGSDGGHTSYIDTTFDPATLSPAWTAGLGFPQSGTGSWAEQAVAIDSTHVYRTDLEGYSFNGTYHVFAFNVETGAQDWHRTFIGNAHAGVGEPSVANGIVYVNRAGHSSGGTLADWPRLYGLSAATGATVYEQRYEAQWGYNERPAIDGNQIVVNDGYYGGMGSYSLGLGRQWWVGGRQLQVPNAAFDDQYVYAYDNVVFNRTTGAQVRSLVPPTGYSTVADPMVSPSGKVLTEVSWINYSNGASYAITAYDGDTHQPVWTTPMPGAVAAKAVGNGVVAVVTGTRLVLLDEATGAQVRSWQAPGNLVGEIVLTRTHAFVQSLAPFGGPATVHAIDLATGREVWSYENRVTTGGSGYMEMAFGSGRLVLSHHMFVKAFAPAGTNRGPDAVDDTATTAEDVSVIVRVLTNDTDPDGDALTVSWASQPAHGTVWLNNDGTITYLGTGNYHGTDSFTYTIRDATGATDQATVTMTVTPANDAPIASYDSYATDEDTALTVNAPGVLANDRDVDGDPMSAVLVFQPSHGTLTFNTDGSFTYTPAANYSGRDDFGYRATDGTATSNTAFVTLLVNAVNDAPVALGDAYATDEDTPLTVVAPGVLANDTDVEGSALSAALVSGPSHGTVTLNANGSFTYTPAANYSGPDSFTYKAGDGSAYSAPATVSLTVNSIDDDPPVAANDSYTLDEDTSLTVAAPGVLGNDTDGESGTLTAVLVSEPAHGTVTFNADGSFTFTPAADYNGADAFTYKANDGTFDSNAATVRLTVRAVNDAPAAAGDAYSTDEDTALTIAAPGVLANDTDIDGNPLTAALVVGPAHGTVTLNANGSFTYTPAANYSGPDSFTYKANDGTADSAPATVGLTVNAVNDAPAAADDRFDLDEDHALVVNAPGVLINDSDVDGPAPTAAVLAQPQHGTLAFAADGGFTYTPDANYNGSDSFTYRAYDGSAYSTSATVTLTVRPVNDAPTFTKGADQTVLEDAGAQAVPGWATAISSGPADEAAQALTFQVSTDNPALFAAGPAVDATGRLTYTPAADASGSAKVTVRLQDNGGTANGGADTSAAQEFTIAVTPRPDVTGVEVNQGAAQRSRVTQIAVTFDSVVTLAPGAFTLTRVSDGLRVGVINVSTATVNGQTVVTLTFAGTGTQSGSLSDGRWDLRVLRGQVQSNGVTMAADATSTLHRLFGDSNGDRRVDAVDKAAFDAAFGKKLGQPGYVSFFDFDQDGDVDSKDRTQFRQRQGTSI